MGGLSNGKRKRKRGRDPQSYVSKDPDKRARQLANLKQGDAPKQWGQTYSLKYGGRATDRTLPVAGKAALIYEELADAAPLRDQDGSIPKADRVVVELFALCLARLDACTTYLAMHGPLDLKGKVRPAAEYEVKLRREAASHADSLGMSPRSRARLGLDLTRTQSFAEQMQQMSGAGDRLRQRADQIAIDATAQDETHAEASPPAPGAVVQEGSDSVPTEAHSERQEGRE